VGQYKVIFYGLAVAGPEEEARLLKGIQKKFNLTPEKAERLLQKVPVVVKKGTSPEEMEKYLKAFQEIGGKVTLEEEEPLSELKEAPETAEPKTKEFVGKTMTCPQCAFEQPETNACVKCGLEFARYEPYREVASQGQAIPSEVKEAPTESEAGFFGSFFRTTRDVLFSPVRFFRKSAAGERYGFPLIYGLITGIIGMGGTMVWQYILFAKLFHFWTPPDISYGFELFAGILALPLAVLVFVFLGTAVTHICLTIVGATRWDFVRPFGPWPIRMRPNSSPSSHLSEGPSEVSTLSSCSSLESRRAMGFLQHGPSLPCCFLSLWSSSLGSSQLFSFRFLWDL